MKEEYIGNRRVNFRVSYVGDILKEMKVSSLLDVGCRDCQAKLVIPESIEYYGNDLFQNRDGSVDFVGDVMTMDFGRSFDCVIALDVVEHVENPYVLFEKLIGLSDRYLIISLPNIYDIFHKMDFVFRNSLGGKYKFGREYTLDRHRWVMNYDEIHDFYIYFSEKFNLDLITKDLIIGEKSKSRLLKAISSFFVLSIGRKNMTKAVMGVFEKKY